MGSGGMHTYEKLWSFVKVQSIKLQEQNRMLVRRFSGGGNDEEAQNEQNNAARFRLKALAYFEAGIHTILGFVLVTTVAYAIPDVIHNPTRLALFWMYVFTYLFLGLLTFLGLYHNSVSTLKAAVGVFVSLQVVALLISSRLISQCNSSNNTPLNSTDDKVIGDCKHASFISTWILVPLFIHSVIFCFIICIYIYKFVNHTHSSVQNEKIHQFANIKIIIEEVL